jgi:hypothetical protein
MDYSLNNELPFALTDGEEDQAQIPHEGDVLLF